MRTLIHQPDVEPKMTRLQAALQSYLRAHSGETITREQLCAAVWQMNYFRWSRTIDQTVSVVRKHLAEGEKIVTVFGVGYRHETRVPRQNHPAISQLGNSPGGRITASLLLPSPS
jgi:DNA-binding response OmpR family regulator